MDVGLDDDEYWVAWTLRGIFWIGFTLSSFSDDFDFFGLLDAEASVDDFLGRPLKLRILELLNFRKNTENYVGHLSVIEIYLFLIPLAFGLSLVSGTLQSLRAVWWVSSFR